MDSMIETLMDLPLFRGSSYERMSEIVGKFKFHFLKYLPGNELIASGQPCTSLIFLLTGAVRATISNDNGRFKMVQPLPAPSVITPEFLFGRLTYYPCSATVVEPTNILQVSKNDYLRILSKDPVFLLNYLNSISSNAQRAVDGILALTSGSIEERIGLWVACLTQSEAKDIVIQCRLRDMYTMFGVPRGSFIAALDNLKDAGIIDYTATEITVLKRAELIRPVVSAPSTI